MRLEVEQDMSHRMRRCSVGTGTFELLYSCSICFFQQLSTISSSNSRERHFFCSLVNKLSEAAAPGNEIDRWYIAQAA